MSTDGIANLERQIKRLERHIQQMQHQSEQFVRWRLGLFVAGLGAIFLGFQVSDSAAFLTFIVWLIAFWSLVLIHGRLKRMLQRFTIWHEIKTIQHARRQLDWVNIPPESALTQKNHPYALDIDITGEYSIHRLLDTTISTGGSQRLLDWLLNNTPSLEMIQRRQAQLKQLIPLGMFRDKLTLQAQIAAGRIRDTKWEGGFLLRWLNQETAAPSLPLVLILAALSVANIVLFWLSRSGDFPQLWVGTFVVYMLLSGWSWSRWTDAFSQSMRLQNELKRLSAVLRYLENYHYGKHDLIREVCQPFLEARPSKRIWQLSFIVGALGLRGNPVVWFVLNFIIPWDVFWMWRLSEAKGDLAVTLPRWLDVWYELEALNALAEFAARTSGAIFPTVTEHGGLIAKQVGHPLIPGRVTNDFQLSELGQVVIITGSNMSGKSSFLRTIGVNMVLAYAGGCVLAESLELGLFRLFSCIRVTDSVVDGISYFYAEVKRLRALLDVARQADEMPLFFLIDEIFRGTNNRERLIGSRSYIKALVGGHSLGLISTHDLELVTLADTIPQISNYHFREKVEDNRMVFDYILRTGPSPTTNALKIMAIEGLPVEHEV